MRTTGSSCTGAMCASRGRRNAARASFAISANIATRRSRRMFTPSRDEARRFLVDAWAKYRAGAPLTGLEQLAAGIVALHPEYHAILEDPERHLDRDYRPEAGAVNPFLHLSLHLAVAEQLGI